MPRTLPLAPEELVTSCRSPDDVLELSLAVPIRGDSVTSLRPIETIVPGSPSIEAPPPVPLPASCDVIADQWASADGMEERPCVRVTSRRVKCLPDDSSVWPRPP